MFASALSSHQREARNSFAPPPPPLPPPLVKLASPRRKLLKGLLTRLLLLLLLLLLLTPTPVMCEVMTLHTPTPLPRLLPTPPAALLPRAARQPSPSPGTGEGHARGQGEGDDDPWPRPHPSLVTWSRRRWCGTEASHARLCPLSRVCVSVYYHTQNGSLVFPRQVETTAEAESIGWLVGEATHSNLDRLL